MPTSTAYAASWPPTWGCRGTRQVGNRLAYAWLLEELKRTPDLYPAMVPSRSVHLISRDVQRGSTVEILEIGWRH